MDRLEIKKIYDRIAILYNKPKLEAEQLREYETLYADYTYNEINEALTAYAKDKQFMPNPAQLLKTANGLRFSQHKQISKAKRGPDGERLVDCPYCCDSGWNLIDGSHLGKPLLGIKCHCRSDIPDFELQKRLKTGYQFVFSEGGIGCWSKSASQETWVGDTLDFEDNVNSQVALSMVNLFEGVF